MVVEAALLQRIETAMKCYVRNPAARSFALRSARCLVLSCAAALAACRSGGQPTPRRAPRQQQVVIAVEVGGSPRLLRGHYTVDDLTVGDDALRATTAGEWRDVCAAIGGNRGELPRANFSIEQLVLVPLPASHRVTRIAIGTEEGVDVVTLECGSDETDAAKSQPVCVLRLAQRATQLAVVVRVNETGNERTAAVFDPL